jgi:uncharacterized protein DUF1844
MAEEQSGFKVADRRLFTEEGDLRDDVARESTKERAFDDTLAGSDSQKSAQSEPGVPMTFQTLVFSLSTTAMLQLGFLSNPETGKREKNLPAAKQTIDILQILQEKTKGNLTSEESQLLEASLYDLKMTYLKATNNVKL